MSGLGPYRTASDHSLIYNGNSLFKPGPLNGYGAFSQIELQQRPMHLANNDYWGDLARINDCIFEAAVDYFRNQGALFTALPLTTRMISSPGAFYGQNALTFTTDTTPITLKWFDLEQPAFLSESSQIYLELALLQQRVDHVFSIYNSFRKEQTDATHLSEFHHIEYEGHVGIRDNLAVAENCLRALITAILARHRPELAKILRADQIDALEKAMNKPKLFEEITFAEALQILYKDTNNKEYLRFTLDNTFSRWEEVRLTEILMSPVIVHEFPLYEVPFYHAQLPESSPAVAINADFLWAGYAEIIGAGERIHDLSELEHKAKAFNLPMDDYQPYLQSRTLEAYRPSSGFGLGWERFLQGLLCLPTISWACPFPRSHDCLIP